jgi:TIR domain
VKHFFISYNREDRAWAEWIAWQLEEAGFSVVVQAWDFRQGGNFVLDMQRAIEEAERTLVVLSPSFLASQFTAPEWAAAFAKDPTGAKGLLLPVRVKDCNPTGLLAQIVYTDLVGAKDRTEARERLLAGVNKARAKPLSEPPMPLLEVGQPRAVAGPEPEWPGLQEVVRAAGTGLKRALRMLGVAFVVALAMSWYWSAALPQWSEQRAGQAHALALALGLGASVIVELLAWALRSVWGRARSPGLDRA